MKLIDQLVQRMEGKNLSEIARRAGVARDHVTDISRGRIQNMKVVTYEKLSAALDDMEYPNISICCNCEFVMSGVARKCSTCGGNNLERF